jgi:hypothetical protein
MLSHAIAAVGLPPVPQHTARLWRMQLEPAVPSTFQKDLGSTAQLWCMQLAPTYNGNSAITCHCCCPYYLFKELGQHDACVPKCGAQVLRAGVLRQTQVDPATAAGAAAASRAAGCCGAAVGMCAVHSLLLVL